MRRGFTLVELSIVLVIIGLLTGGVLTGQSLIRASELRSVTTDSDRIRTAVFTFRDKYFAIPGDMPNATQYWGTLAGTGSDSTCQSTPATGTATCNGDGDGTWVSTSGVTNAELFRVWQHLANAGLITGSYTGVANAAAPLYTPNVNVLGSKITQAYFLPNNYGGTSGYFVAANLRFSGYYGRAIEFNSVGFAFPTPGSFPLRPEEAYNIDTKMDDGLPGTGKVFATKGNGVNTFCSNMAGVNPPADAGGVYQLTNTSKDCALYFVLF